MARSYRLSWLMTIWGSVFQLLLFYYLAQIFNPAPITITPGHQVAYFPYVMVGIALHSMLTNGITVFTNSLRAEQTTGTLEVLFTLPTSPSVIMLGMASYGFVYSILSSILLLSVAITLFGLRPVLNIIAIGGTLITLIASLLLFASVGIMIGAFTIVFKRSNALVGIVTQVLGLLSGVFFPISVLPGAAQLIAQIIPLTWALSIMRQTLLVGDVSSTRVLFLILASAAALPIALWVFYAAMQRARRDGSLGQY